LRLQIALFLLKDDKVTKKFHANGKLLLTGEYFVLDGAVALALPTLKYGQTLHTAPNNAPFLRWQALDTTLGNTRAEQLWLDITFDREGEYTLQLGTTAIADTLQKLLRKAAELTNQPFFWSQNIETVVNYPRAWGLGSSSTLVSLVAQWSGADAYALNMAAFGSSGYDIACATAQQPIFYENKIAQSIVQCNVTVADFAPPFGENLYLVYLGNKQNSREGIAHYRKLSPTQIADNVPIISQLTLDIAQSKDLPTFETLLLQHENILADILQLPRAQTLYFSDYWGIVKSLGAWGGDFVLATSDRSTAETITYFQQKGFKTVVYWDDFFDNKSS
jgi:mevalonate kinase